MDTINKFAMKVETEPPKAPPQKNANENQTATLPESEKGQAENECRNPKRHRKQDVTNHGAI